MRSRDPRRSKFSLLFPAEGRSIDIVPIVKTNTVNGSNTNAIPNARKYRRKKRGESIEPVEKIKRRITELSMKIPKGPSPPIVKNALPFFLADKIR